MSATITPPVEPVLLKVAAAMTALSLSRSVIYELIRAGRLRTVNEGRARLIPRSAINEYVALLEREAGESK
ncbi:helix-turn-helix domain-containing protein [Streptomyces sp. MB09-01]|uniref:helix-turn-helix domain-containing protein n=1 Tax=Streptomyces sp. MB09-01 TaxID=3028666 RepID=UPI0029B50CEA|nr:helix-turn-helix domain-containing protein [Streptomyces sp. MB09-01]MDX3534313.1 helix-turn-helix domain-containing protein [Streptomyces sp. MB09-01]